MASSNKYNLSIQMEVKGFEQAEKNYKQLTAAIDSTKVAVKNYSDVVSLVNDDVTRSVKLQAESVGDAQKFIQNILKNSEKEFKEYTKEARIAFETEQNYAMLGAKTLGKNFTPAKFDEKAAERDFLAQQGIIIRDLQKTKDEINSITLLEKERLQEARLIEEYTIISAVKGAESLVAIKKKEQLDLLRIERETQEKLAKLKDEYRLERISGETYNQLGGEIISKSSQQKVNLQQKNLLAFQEREQERKNLEEFEKLKDYYRTLEQEDFIRFNKNKLATGLAIGKQELEERVKLGKEFAAEELERLKYNIELENLLQIKGSDNLITLKRQEAEKIRRINKELQKDLQKLQEQFNLGQISEQRYKQQARAIIARAEDNINVAQRPYQQAQQQIDINKNNLELFKNSQRELLAEQKRNIENEIATTTYGENSKQAIWTRSANARKSIEENQAKELLAIEEKIKSGILSSAQAEIEQFKILEKNYKNLQGTLKEIPKDTGHITNSFYNMIKHITEVYLVWGLLNTAVSRTQEFFKGIVTTGIELDSTFASLTATMGGSAGANSALAALHTESERTGVSIKALWENFRNLQASTSLAGVSLKDTWKIFTNLNTASTALHLSADQTNHVFLAITQIFNKSKVQSEELVKQLGNLLPGAFASFAKSMGKTTEELNKMLRDGVVYAQDTILKFTEFYANRFAGSFAIASTQLNSNIGRFQSSLIELQETLYKTSNGALNNFIKKLTQVTKSVTELVSNEEKFNTILYVTRDSLLSIIGIAIFPYLEKASAGLLAASKNATLLEGALVFLKSPVVLITGLTALTQHFLDLAHAEGEAARRGGEVAKGIIEAAGKGVKPIELDIEINKDDILKQLRDGIEKDKEDLNTALARRIRGRFQEDVKHYFSTEDFQQIANRIGILTQAQMRELNVSAEEVAGHYLDMDKYIKLLAFGIQNATTMEKNRLEIVKDEIALREHNELESRLNTAPKIDTNEQIKKSELLKSEAAILKQQAQTLEGITGKESERIALLEKAKELEKQGMVNLEEEKKHKQLAEWNRVEEFWTKELEVIKKAHGGVIDPNIMTANEKEVFEAATKQFKILLDERENLRKVSAGRMAEIEMQYAKKAHTEAVREAKDLSQDIARDAKTALIAILGEIEILKGEYKEGKIGIEDYFRKLKELEEKPIQIKIKGQTEALDMAFKQGDQRDIDRAKDFLEQANEELNTLQTKYNEEKRQAIKDFYDSIKDRHANVLSLQGDTSSGELEKLKLQNEKATNELLSNRNLLSETAYTNARKELDTETALKILNKEMADIGKDKELDATHYADKLQEINDLVQTGALGELSAWKMITDANQEQIKLLKEKLVLMDKAIAKAKQISPDGTIDAKLINARDKTEKELNKLEDTADVIGNRIQSSLSSNFSQAFSDMITGTQSVKNAFKSLATSILKGLADIVAKEASTVFTNAIVKKNSSGGFNWGSLITGLIGAASGAFGGETLAGVGGEASLASVTPSGGAVAGTFQGVGGINAKGNVFDGMSNVIPFAKGGVVDRPTNFKFANGTGLMGEAGAEAVMPLGRNSKGELGVKLHNEDKQTNDNSSKNTFHVNITVEKGKNDSPESTGNKIAEAFVRSIASQEILRATRTGGTLNRKIA